MKFETAPAFFNTGSYYSTRISQRVNVDTDLTVGDDLSLTSDSAVFNMGAGNDFTITHDGTTGATIAGNPVTITSAGAATWSASSGQLTIDAAGGIVINDDGDDEDFRIESDDDASNDGNLVIGWRLGATRLDIRPDGRR